MVLSASISFLSTDLREQRVASPDDFIFQLEHAIENLRRGVVVHGGGKAITRAMEKAGLKAAFVQGQRITDARAIEVVDLQALGLNTIRERGKLLDVGATVTLRNRVL